jgi:hypothetical protein
VRDFRIEKVNATNNPEQCQSAAGLSRRHMRMSY